MNNWFIITKLKLTWWKDIQPAEVLFKSGVNLIVWPSNTWKTFIFECIRYMLWSTKTPKEVPEANNYSEIFLEIKDSSSNYYTLKSDLIWWDIFLFENEITEISNITTNVLNRKFNQYSNNNLSDFFLNLINIKNKKIRKNDKWNTVNLTYSLIRNLTLVDEVKIMTDKSPIVTEQYTDQTKEKNFIKFLLTWNDDSNIKPIISDKEITNKKWRLALLNDLIIKYNKDIDNIEKQNNNQSHDDIKNIINKKVELKDNIKIKLNSLNKEKKELENQLNDLKYKIYDIEETLIRSELLKKQYETDVFRLKSTIEAGQLLLQWNNISKCYLCNSKIESEIDNNNISLIIESSNIELSKINIFQEELHKATEIFEDDKINLIKSKEGLEQKINNIESEIDENLEKTLNSLLEELNNLLVLENDFNKIGFIKEYTNDLLEEKDKIEELIKNNKNPEKTNLSISLFTSVCSIMKDYLDCSKYDYEWSIFFDESNNDLIFWDKKRALSWKWYRAITYSLFILSIAKYIRKNKNYSLWPILLDSPVVTYKESNKNDLKDWDIIPENIAMNFYRCISKDADLEQIIIMENKDAPNDINNINRILFTWGNEWRKWFIPN